MDVDGVTTDDPGRRDGHRLTELIQPLAQQIGTLGVAPAQQVHHLELWRWGLRSDFGDWPARRRLVDLAIRRLPSDRRAQRIQKHQQTAATGIDHARVAQHVKLLGSLLQRDHRGLTGDGDRR